MEYVKENCFKIIFCGVVAITCILCAFVIEKSLSNMTALNQIQSNSVDWFTPIVFSVLIVAIFITTGLVHLLHYFKEA